MRVGYGGQAEEFEGGGLLLRKRNANTAHLIP